MKDPSQVRVTGPLGPHAEGFRAELARQGYASSSAVNQLKLVGHLSRWMTIEGLSAPELVPAQIGRYVAARRAARYRHNLSELRLADRITAFAGSMKFVYLHVVVFAVWMLFIERRPRATLTLIVSLEAIFLSTFVMIGQNRQAAFQQAKADHDFTEQELELKTNTQLTREIHTLTAELHKRFLENPARQQS